MEIKPKHIVVGASILGISYYLLKSKLNDWRDIMKQLKVIPTDFRNLNFSGGKITFDTELTIFNRSAQDFYPDGLIAQLQRVDFFAFGVKIATININQSSLNLPANGIQVLKGLKCEVNYQLLPTILKIRSSADIQSVAIMGVLGQEYQI